MMDVQLPLYKRYFTVEEIHAEVSAEDFVNHKKTQLIDTVTSSL